MLSGNECSLSQLEALASWRRRERENGALRVQVFAAPAWRTVMAIQPAAEADMLIALKHITALLPAVRWRIAGKRAGADDDPAESAPQ